MARVENERGWRMLLPMVHTLERFTTPNTVGKILIVMKCFQKEVSHGTDSSSETSAGCSVLQRAGTLPRDIFQRALWIWQTTAAQLLLSGKKTLWLNAEDPALRLDVENDSWDALVLDNFSELSVDMQQPLCDLIRSTVGRPIVCLSRGKVPSWLLPFQVSGDYDGAGPKCAGFRQTVGGTVAGAPWTEGERPDADGHLQREPRLSAGPVHFGAAHGEWRELRTRRSPIRFGRKSSFIMKKRFSTVLI